MVRALDPETAGGQQRVIQGCGPRREGRCSAICGGRRGGYTYLLKIKINKNTV